MLREVELRVIRINKNMAKKKQSKKLEPLEEIKRLLILGLIHNGVQANDIATILNVNKSTISRIVPVLKIKVKK
jgi:DNA invertase Pin-like site-specific DNA recombinase